MARITQNTINIILSAMAGVIFGVGWFIFIDGVVYGHSHGALTVPWYFYLNGPAATLALAMVNIISIDQLNPFFMFSESISSRVRLWLLFWFVLAFANLGFAIWELTIYQENIKKSVPAPANTTSYPGVSLLVQVLVILFSTFVFLFASKKHESSEEYPALV